MGQCGCKDQLADCWKHQDKDAGGWTRKAPLPVEWSRDKGMNLRARYEAKPRQESLARGKNRTASCLRSPICSPVREERLTAPFGPSLRCLSCPCWYMLGALLYLVSCPAS